MLAARFTDALFQAGFWLPLALCTYLALVPEPPEHAVFRLGDVVLHGFAFTVLTVALQLAYGLERRGRRGLTIAFFAMLAYGVALELAQGFIPERSAELKDLWVDVIGILLGLGLGSFLVPPLRRGVLTVATRLLT